MKISIVKLGLMLFAVFTVFGITANKAFSQCDPGWIELNKYTNGDLKNDVDWRFEIYDGLGGFGKTPQLSGTTLDSDPAGLVLDDPIWEGPYTICELEIPGGWETSWVIDGTPVASYNPNAPEELGNRFVDFGTGQDFPVWTDEH